MITSNICVGFTMNGKLIKILISTLTVALEEILRLWNYKIYRGDGYNSGLYNSGKGIKTEIIPDYDFADDNHLVAINRFLLELLHS